jgi:hypothetical protein
MHACATARGPSPNRRTGVGADAGLHAPDSRHRFRRDAAAVNTVSNARPSATVDDGLRSRSAAASSSRCDGREDAVPVIDVGPARRGCRPLIGVAVASRHLVNSTIDCAVGLKRHWLRHRVAVTEVGRGVVWIV